MLCHLPYSQPLTEAEVHGRYWGRLAGPVLGEGQVSYGSCPAAKVERTTEGFETI